MKIEKARISNWKSFPHDGNPEWMEFSDFNIFIGPNGAGKTNYVNAIRLLLHGSIDFGSKRRERDIDMREFNVSHPSDPIKIEIELKNGEWISKEFYNPDSIVNYKYDPKIETYKRFFFPKGPEIKPINDYGRHIASGSPQSNVELTIDNWGIIRDDFRKYFGINLSENSPKYQKDNFFEDVMNEIGVPLSEFGSGVVRAFYLLTEILILKDQRKIFLFEEPEVHLHPELLRRFIQFIKYVISEYKMQFFITSHSSVLIDETDY